MVGARTSRTRPVLRTPASGLLFWWKRFRLQRPAELRGVSDVLNYVGAPQKCRPKLESPTAPGPGFLFADRLKSQAHKPLAYGSHCWNRPVIAKCLDMDCYMDCSRAGGCT